MNPFDIWPALLLAFASGLAIASVPAYYAARKAREFASLLDFMESASARYQADALKADTAHLECAKRLRSCQKLNEDLLAHFESMAAKQEGKK